MNTVILFGLGLCFGSFVNALVWRLHEQAEQTKAKGPKLKANKFSILNGRSMCINCHHTLAWYDLLPVISWLSLGGKCRYCKKPISPQYPIVELLTAVLFTASYLYWPFSILDSAFLLLFILWLVLLTGFIALMVYDIRWYLLPNKIVFPLQAIAGVFGLFMLYFYPQTYNLLQLLLAVAFSAGFFLIIYAVSGGKWIGFGDVKLAVVLGLVLGRADLALLMLFLSSALGSFVAIPLLITGRATKSSKLPFGPFLILGSITSFLFGTVLINWFLAGNLFNL